MRLAALLCLGSFLTLPRCMRAKATSTYLQWLRDANSPALAPTSSDEAMATFPTALQPSTINDFIQIFTLPIKSSNNAEATEVNTFVPQSLASPRLKKEEQKTLKQLRYILQTLLDSLTESNETDTVKKKENQQVYIIDINTTEEVQPTLMTPTSIQEPSLEFSSDYIAGINKTEETQTTVMTPTSTAEISQEFQSEYITDINKAEETQTTVMTPTSTAETSQGFQSDTTTRISAITISFESNIKQDLRPKKEVTKSNYMKGDSDEEVVNNIEGLNQEIESVPNYSQVNDIRDYRNDTEKDLSTSFESEDEQMNVTPPKEQQTEVTKEENKAMRRFVEIVQLLEGAVPDLNTYLGNLLHNVTDKEASQKAFAILAVLKNCLCTSQKNADFQENIDKLLQDEIKILKLLMKKQN